MRGDPRGRTGRAHARSEDKRRDEKTPDGMAHLHYRRRVARYRAPQATHEPERDQRQRADDRAERDGMKPAAPSSPRGDHAPVIASAGSISAMPMARWVTKSAVRHAVTGGAVSARDIAAP